MIKIYMFTFLSSKLLNDLPEIIALLSVFVLFPNTTSERPTKTSPITTKHMPSHMCLKILRLRNATDNKAVKTITAPEKNG